VNQRSPPALSHLNTSSQMVEYCSSSCHGHRQRVHTKVTNTSQPNSATCSELNQI